MLYLESYHSYGKVTLNFPDKQKLKLSILDINSCLARNVERSTSIRFHSYVKYKKKKKTNNKETNNEDKSINTPS